MHHSLLDITNAIESIAPLAFAEPWDKVGLLVTGDGRAIARVMLTIDLTSAVLDEAKAQRIDLIIAYHPLLFTPLVRLDGATWQCRVAIDALRAGIAVYSPHTALDAAGGGVNDWLMGIVRGAAPHALSGAKPITPGVSPEVGAGRIAQLETPVSSDELARRLELGLGCGRIERTRVDPKSAEHSSRLHRVCAVCAGSGASLLEAAALAGASAFVTGELTHHDVLRAHSLGLEVFLAGHTNTERGYLPLLARRLSLLTPAAEFVVSTVDQDPLAPFIHEH